MADFKELKERVIRAKLTKKESDIAEFILNNLNRVCFMSTSDLAKELNTSNTSVNRTAKALGYKVFNDLQKEIQDYVSRQVSSTDRYRLPLTQRILKPDNELSEGNLILSTITY